MNFFSYLYNKTIDWSKYPRASYYLAAVSFSESSFFPIPPDVMLISMGLAKPENSWRYAMITTFFSILGGIFGYCIGLFGFELIEPYLLGSHYNAPYQTIVHWFQTYGVWVVFIAGFSPIPYKLFTIAAGALQMSFLPFILASAVGRGLRFFLVSAIMFYYGDQLHQGIRKYIDRIAWSLLVVFIIAFFIIKFAF